MSQMYGKYRAMVVDNLDPEQARRLLVEVPAVSPGSPSWAVPLHAHDTSTLPDVGAEIWVEYEAGDVNYPIWEA